MVRSKVLIYKSVVTDQYNQSIGEKNNVQFEVQKI